MKKILWILLAGVLLLCVVSCGASPRSALDGMMAAAKAGDEAGFRSHCGGDFLKLIEASEEFVAEMEAEGMPTNEMDMSGELGKAMDVEITEKEVTGDTAKYDVSLDGNTTTFIVKKIGGTWKVCDFEDGEANAASVLEMMAEMKKMMEGMDMSEMMKGMEDMPEMPDIPEPPSED